MFRLIFISILVLLVACKKSEPTTPTITFSGISSKDEAGNSLTQDTADWLFNRVWSDKEISLFSSILKTNHNCTVPKQFLMLAYPNPCTNAINIYAGKNADTKVELRLVDTDFNILLKNDTILTSNNMFQINLTTLQKKGLLRLYYRFLEQDCEYRGYGDIEVR